MQFLLGRVVYSCPTSTKVQTAGAGYENSSPSKAETHNVRIFTTMSQYVYVL
jgi:hypothetical protein